MLSYPVTLCIFYVYRMFEEEFAIILEKFTHLNYIVITKHTRIHSSIMTIRF